MDSGKAADLAVFVICIFLLIAYNVLYFTKWFQRMKIHWRGHTYIHLWSVGTESRAVWAGAMMADPKEGITAAQTVRNMVMGVSVLAAATAVLVGQLILLLTDSARLNQLNIYSGGDPISGADAIMPPQARLGIAMGVLFLSLIAMTQCVRLSVHLTYILRAVPAADPRRGARLQKIAFQINRRASLFFSIGLRFQYAFFPVFLYILGPLALLISTLVEIVALFVMDLTPDDELYKVDPDEHETEEELENSMTKIRKSMSDDDSSRQTGAHIDNGSMVIPLQHAAD